MVTVFSAIQVQPAFLISDIRALWRSRLSARVPECPKLTQRDRAAAVCCAYFRKVDCAVVCTVPLRAHWLFTSEIYRLTEHVVIIMHIDATTG